jgi:LPXTG-site transpeptidase (sortase) family protein
MKFPTFGLSKREFLRILALRTLGNFLVLFSLYMLSWVFYKPFVEEVKYAYNNIVGKRYVVADQAPEDPQFVTRQSEREKGLLARSLEIGNVEVLVPKDPNFSIIIPKLGANANIVSNVNSADSESYMKALENGVAHASGTKFPGEEGHIYLFAHSTNTFSNVSRYNAIFYLLYKLEAGDEINVYYQGIRHAYRVIGKEIVDPSQVHYLTRKTNEEFLTLQTCWPPGTISQRMLVFAEPVSKLGKAPSDE